MEILLVVQTGLYFLIAVLGFFVVIPVAVTSNNFGGGCILYGQVEWQENNHFKFLHGPDSVCEFNIYLHVGIAMLYALFVGAIHIFLIVKEKKNEQLEVPKVVRLALIIANGLSAFLTLVSAGTLSAGLSYWCSQLMEGVNHGAFIEKCSDAQSFQYTGDIYGGSFHTCLAFALVVAWLAFITWCVQFAIGLYVYLEGLPSFPEKSLKYKKRILSIFHISKA